MYWENFRPDCFDRRICELKNIGVMVYWNLSKYVLLANY